MSQRRDSVGKGVGVKAGIEVAVGVAAFHLELMHWPPNEDAIAAESNLLRRQ